MGHSDKIEVSAARVASPTKPAGEEPGKGEAADCTAGSRRLCETLHRQDVIGERAIAVAQASIALFLLVLHVVAQVGSGHRFGNPWVILALSGLVASSALRLSLSRREPLPERALDILNVVDIAVFLGLIWSYQFAYQHPAGGVLKAPSTVLLFVLVAARALRFHPRPILLAGGAAAVGWALVVLAAVMHDGAPALTRSYPGYLTSYRILIGAELERIAALAALVLLLAFAADKAREILSRSAHASDYAEALEAARCHLDEATQARTRAEAALGELDRRDAEREELNAQLEQQHQLLKVKEEQLRTQYLQLDAALNNIVQGLAMFDAEHRLVLCNQRYTEIYGLTPEQVRPGTTLRQIIDHRIANGLKSELSTDAIVDGMLRRRDSEFGQLISQLGDGRCIAITVRPMADGGTVTTHQDITEQRRSEAKIAHMAHHDALTGLPNRVKLNGQLEQALARVKRGEVIAAHLLDLDHFKHVNDTLGHAAGDKLLKLVTERLRALVRETDTIARMGGDEFAILQAGVGQPAEAGALALRVIEAVSEPYDIDGQQVNIGTSVGIAIGPGDGLTPDVLMRNADLALYGAKGDGRGAFRFFEPAMDAQMQERRTMERDLRRALAAGQFELHYQPVVNLESNEISAFEALIRWHHPERGLIPPATFIPLAEEIGFIVPLGEWAMRQACTTAATWPDDLRVAVNLSPAQFRNPGLVNVVVGALAASGLPAHRLELEITETILLQDNEGTLAVLYQLRELGVLIAMDDFGTGYSSLSYLQSFPFDRIKIDRSFVKDIADGLGSLNIVRAVAAMAKGLNMATTAEGVETQEQRDTVKSEGCTEMQGYLFSKPLPAAEIERLYLAPRRHANSMATPSAA
jgi:diguanylate cyclase (GGDEF)-like protein